MIKQNKNTSAIWGRIASGFAACILLFSLVAVPSVFAAPDGQLPLYVPSGTGSVGAAEVVAHGIDLYSEGSQYGTTYVSSSVSNSFAGLVNGNNYCFASTDPFSFYIGTTKGQFQVVTPSYNGVYYIYLDLFSTSNRIPTSNLPSYSSLSDFASFVSSSSSSGSAFLVPTSYTSVSSFSYIKALMSDVSGYAYYFDGTYYNLVVGNISAQNIVTIASDTSQHPVNTPSMLTFDDDPIYYTANAMRVSESDVPEGAYFTNLNDAVEAIYNVVSATGSQPSQNIANSLNLSLNPGNVAFIDISGLSSQIGSIHVSLNGMAYYTLSDFNSKMNYMIGYATELPESFSLPIPNTSKIIWTTERGVDKPTATGTYNSFSYFFDYNFSQGKYLVIVNPVYDSLPVDSATVLDINAYNTNNVLNISCEANSYYIYSLSVSVGYEDGQSTYESFSTSSQYVGEYDPNTDTWTSTNVTTGEPGTPSYGGDVVTPTLTVGEQSKRFINWLQDFLKNFVDIFDVGKSAIMTLVGYGSSFFSAISGLYAWLPSSVYSVLTSSLVLVFVIGVIKVFL